MKNVKLNSANEVNNDLSDTVWLDLSSNEKDIINTGTYFYSKTRQEYNYIQDGGYNYREVVGGFISIIFDGNNYNIEYELDLDSGKTITGNFKGKINLVE